VLLAVIAFLIMNAGSAVVLMCIDQPFA